MAHSIGETEPRRGTPHLWRFANVEFDERSFELRVGGVLVEVERAPMRVLRELLETPRELVSRERLLASVWKRKPETISRNALTNAIGKLRRAIGDESQSLVVATAGEGYRLEAEVERRALPPLQSLNQILKPGEHAPLRPNWVLRERIDATESSEVWIVEQAKTRERRVFKYAGDGFQLAALRREITISRLLREALGARAEFVRIHDWNLDQPPYFIESDFGGMDLAHWAARREGLGQVPMAERLRIVADLADAVALAHSVGALHKDLKPGNVLIDDQARVRVLDFGSGRVLEPELLDQFQITRIALPDADPNTGTPFYLAPELLSGQAPTVASDVYSIGVLLYQFVVGDLQRPIAPGWESEIDDALLREDIAATANGNPARRPTAAELAHRLRTLDARRAERETTLAESRRTEALQKQLAFAEQRRRGLRWVVATLVVGMAATLTLYAKLLHTQQQREAALQLADRESANSREIARYLSSLFETANPEKTGGKPIDPRRLVDYGREQLERQAAQPPVVRARLMAALADLYCKLGEAEPCRRQIEAALELQRQGEKGSPQVIAQMLELKSRADELQIRDDDAEKSLREALALIDRQPDTDTTLLAQILQELGTTLQRQGKNQDARVMLERARSLQRGPDGADTLASVKTLISLSMAELDTGHGDEALVLANQIVRLAETSAGRGDLRYFDALANQAAVLMGKLRYPEAESLMRQALAGYQQVYGLRARRVFDMKSALVDLLNRQGRLRESSALAADVVENMRPTAGPDDPAYAVALNDAGIARQRYGDYEGALQWIRQAYEIDQRHFGEGQPQTVVIANNLGLTLVLAGHAEEALRFLRREIPPGADIDYSRGRRLVLIGQALSALGRYDEAAAIFDQADAQMAALTDTGQQPLNLVRSARGRSLAVQSKWAEALPLLERTLAEQLKVSVADDPRVLEMRSYIALCQAALGNAPEARRAIGELRPLVERNLAPTHIADRVLRQAERQLAERDRPAPVPRAKR